VVDFHNKDFLHAVLVTKYWAVQLAFQAASPPHMPVPTTIVMTNPALMSYVHHVLLIHYPQIVTNAHPVWLMLTLILTSLQVFALAMMVIMS
jgi:hypothetical protein